MYKTMIARRDYNGYDSLWAIRESDLADYDVTEVITDVVEMGRKFEAANPTDDNGHSFRRARGGDGVDYRVYTDGSVLTESEAVHG